MLYGSCRHCRRGVFGCFVIFKNLVLLCIGGHPKCKGRLISLDALANGSAFMHSKIISRTGPGVKADLKTMLWGKEKKEKSQFFSFWLIE